MEQDANLAKQMYITGQDELEESRALLEDVSKQLEDYRRKVSRSFKLISRIYNKMWVNISFHFYIKI